MFYLKDLFLKEETEDEIRKRLKLSKEYSFYYRNKWIIDTFHKIDRIKDRGEAKSAEKLFKKIIDHLIDNKLPAKRQYLFVSKSLNLATVVDYRKDAQHRVKGNHPIIVTWLGDISKLNPPKTPKTLFAAKKGDKKIILEYDDSKIEFDELIYL